MIWSILSYVFVFILGLIMGVLIIVAVAQHINKKASKSKVISNSEFFKDELRKITLVNKIEHAHKIANRALGETK